MATLDIRQGVSRNDYYHIRLTLKRHAEPDQEAEAEIQFALTDQEQEDLRWYLEDYLQHAATVERVTAQQVEALMVRRGEELYSKVLAANANPPAVWFSIR